LKQANLRGMTKHSDLKKLITERTSGLYLELLDSPILEALGLNKGSFDQHFKDFQTAVRSSFFERMGSTFRVLRQAFLDKGEQGLIAQLKYAFYGHVTSSRFTKSDLSNQSKLADLRYPMEWYPGTRTVQRTLHLHVGPTNSGKTYHALKRLEQAERGVYAGPLRLLAHEVYTRLNANGKPCNLFTGDDRKLAEDLAEGKSAKMASCTVEMVPLNDDLEVAVIDEIQMIGSVERGWAWTQALLGLKAKELHLCGEERAVPLIRELAAMMGDKLVIHQYQRLSPLRAMTTSLNGDLRKLRKGDCLVAFSRLGIHALRREVEQATGKRVAVVYGSLPPETRAQQAKLFNDPDNDYDILVASDAIGMGLNLSVPLLTCLS
jgi:ATP-dependent RNA helicase SUPV3L1/SUV3